MSELDTLADSLGASARNVIANASVLSLGVMWHKDARLIGAVTPLRFDKAGKAAVCRLSPSFKKLGDSVETTLLDQHISRSPIIIERVAPQQFAFTPPASSMSVSVNGRIVKERTVAALDELGEEIIIALGNSAILCICDTQARQNTTAPEEYGLTGVSRNMALTRDAIRRVADVNIPVLIRGETGTGKELVAQAIHRASNRTKKPLLAVNMATLSPSLAAAELFGVKRGAFTGASHDKKGLFEQADGGILFMDEIGDMPRDVQPMLLRALEAGEIRRVGDDKIRKIDVRIIAATDRSLDLKENEPSFNQPLLRRLESFAIDMPPLRTRRIDIGLLIKSFLEQGMYGDATTDSHELSLSAIHRMALHSWPGNVRELRNAVQKIILGQPVAFEKLNASTSTPDQEKLVGQKISKPKYRAATTISDEELVGALDGADWVIKDAAKKLNISRTALYELMSKSSKVRKIDDISDDELLKVVQLNPSSIALWAKHLRVGREALRKKIRLSPNIIDLVDRNGATGDDSSPK